VLRGRSKLFWALIALAAAVVVFYLPSLVAYRYTASAQNTQFLTHPWRSWQFLVAAFTVPGDSQLKTSGAAFQAADALFEDTGVNVDAARLLYLRPGEPYSFYILLEEPDTSDGGRDRTAALPSLEVTVVPSFRFVWQIEGTVPRLAGETRVVVAVLDYRSGRTLWNIRDDMPENLIVRKQDDGPD